jgi:hypothetical protein
VCDSVCVRVVRVQCSRVCHETRAACARVAVVRFCYLLTELRPSVPTSELRPPSLPPPAPGCSVSRRASRRAILVPPNIAPLAPRVAPCCAANPPQASNTRSVVSPILRSTICRVVGLGWRPAAVRRWGGRRGEAARRRGPGLGGQPATHSSQPTTQPGIGKRRINERAR